jgi:hypothetical protein
MSSCFIFLNPSRGGVNQELCGVLVNEEAERVVYKNNYSFGAKLLNIYMVRNYFPRNLQYS